VVGECPVFPANNVWNTRITDLPVHPRSDAFIRAIGADAPLGPDFSMPYAVVPENQPKVIVRFDDGDEEILHRYPIPPNVPIEPAVDRHVIVVERGTCMLYELYHARRDGATWRAYSGASWHLTSNALRPDGMTSADAAGLAILPGLLRYIEVAAGFVGHAIRFTAPRTRAAHVWPARKHASYDDDPELPSMGQRFRLRADFDLSGFSPHNQVILTALKHYGFILADNGGPWVFQGVPDARWHESHLEELRTRVHGRDFEAVVGTALMDDSGSGRARAR
jgi:hypothetical protein